jgi:hypothetical protein
MRALTKRQKKARRGPNAAVLHSLKNGYQIGPYVGANPTWRHTPMGIVKAYKGIPFVRGTRVD